MKKAIVKKKKKNVKKHTFHFLHFLRDITFLLFVYINEFLSECVYLYEKQLLFFMSIKNIYSFADIVEFNIFCRPSWIFSNAHKSVINQYFFFVIWHVIAIRHREPFLFLRSICKIDIFRNIAKKHEKNTIFRIFAIF